MDSLRALILAVKFSQDLMEHLAKEKSGQAWDDISVSCLLRRHGIPLLQIKGLFLGCLLKISHLSLRNGKIRVFFCLSRCYFSGFFFR